jgi:hypothetical protein
MNILELIDLEPGTMWWEDDIKNSYKVDQIKIATWDDFLVTLHKPALSIFDRNFSDPQDGKIFLKGYDKSVTNNFKVWYEGRELQSCFPPGNINFDMLTINKHMSVGMYLGQLVLMRSGSNRIEALAKFLLSNKVGWIHLQSKNETQDLVVS